MFCCADHNVVLCVCELVGGWIAVLFLLEDYQLLEGCSSVMPAELQLNNDVLAHWLLHWTTYFLLCCSLDTLDDNGGMHLSVQDLCLVHQTRSLEMHLSIRLTIVISQYSWVLYILHYTWLMYISVDMRNTIVFTGCTCQPLEDTCRLLSWFLLGDLFQEFCTWHTDTLFPSDK